MNDPYAKLFDDFTKVLIKQTNMIIWIAQRTLSAKDYADFRNEFEEKQDKREIIDSLLDKK